MSDAGPRDALQRRVVATILEGAAAALAEGGGRASMGEVAARAGVARATLYRYFPSREALVEALVASAVADAGDRLAAARLDAVPPADALVRAVRALVEVGGRMALLLREGAEPSGFAEAVRAPLAGLAERGRAEGAFRAELPADLLVAALLGLVGGLVSSRPALGRDDLVDAVAGIFLDGARAAPTAGRRARARPVPGG